MNIQRILFSLLVFLYIWSPLKAQDTLEVSSTPISSEIGYDPNESPRSEVNNIIIREIAEDAIKNLKKTHLIFRTAIKSSMVRFMGVTCLKISFDTIDISGDHYFRKFSVSDILKPSLINLTLQIRLVRDSSVVNEFENLTMSVKKNDSIVLPAFYKEFEKNSVRLTVDNISFLYEEADLSGFNKRQHLIDDYYASSAIADSLEPVMKSMDFKRTDLFPEYLIRIEEIGKIEQLIRNRNFEHELSLQFFDPMNLVRKYNDLMRFSRSSAMTLETTLDTIPVVNSRLSTDAIIIEFLSVIQRYMRWSFLINERNSRIYREFLDKYYDLNTFENDEKVFIKLIRKAYPGYDADSVFRDVLVKLKKAYQQEAELLSAGSQYAEAVDLLDHLRRLEDKYEFLKDPVYDKGARMKAAYGIYSSYIGVAESCIKKGNNRMAKWYLEKALHYAQADPVLIPGDSLYRRVLLEYHLSSLSGCDAIHLQGDFSKAIECYHDFLRSLDSISASVLANDVEQRITKSREGMFFDLIREVKRLIRMEKPDSALFIFDQALVLKEKIVGVTSLSASIDSLRPVTERYRYQYLISEVGRNGTQRHFVAAYNALTKAIKIADEQQYQADPELDSLRRRIYPKYIEDQLARARPLIWTNQFLQARFYADSIENILKGNGFKNDPEIRSALNNYRAKIKERVCWVASENMDILMIRAQRNIMSRNYMTALSLLDSALLISRINPDCGLQKEKVRDTIVKYLPAKQYQEMMIKIEGDVSLGLYPGLVNLYLEAGKFYEKYSLQKFGLVHLPLFDYVTSKLKEPFTLSVVNYYENKQEAAEAFRYLKLLRKQGFPIRDAKGLSMSMGKEMASADYRSDPLKDPAISIEKYIEGDKWFDDFAYYYLKEWKRLKMEDRR